MGSLPAYIAHYNCLVAACLDELLEQGSDGGTKINKRTNCYVSVCSLMMGMGNTTCRAKASSCFFCHSQGLFHSNCNEWDFWIHRVSPTQAGVKCNWGSPFKDCKDDKEDTGRKGYKRYLASRVGTGTCRSGNNS